MTRWYELEPADDQFLATAPARTVQTLETTVSPDRLWAALTADDAVRAWSPAVTGVSWLGGAPYGVGTIREVTIARAVTVRELFYRWKEGSQMTFAVAQSTRPGIKRMAEDYLVEPSGTGARLTWTVAVEPAGPAYAARALNPVLGPVIGSMVRGLTRVLDA